MQSYIRTCTKQRYWNTDGIEESKLYNKFVFNLDSEVESSDSVDSSSSSDIDME